jgi:hypothetical protein
VDTHARSLAQRRRRERRAERERDVIGVRFELLAGDPDHRHESP